MCVVRSGHRSGLIENTSSPVTPTIVKKRILREDRERESGARTRGGGVALRMVDEQDGGRGLRTRENRVRAT